MSNFNLPPLTHDMLSLVEQIGEHIGHITAVSPTEIDLNRRRNVKIQNIQASLEIEGNSLQLEQVTAILEGKPVLASPKDLQEVQNAIRCYDHLEYWDSFNLDHLLQAHQMMMQSLISDAGFFRSGTVGIQRGESIIHVAPPANLVPNLMSELFSFINQSTVHPLLKSSIFHYEFEFIHPFSDGNGRVGRLWQTLILAKWNPIFLYIPLESLIRNHQTNYYKALNKSNMEVHSGAFVVYMLNVILDHFKQLTTNQPPVTPPVTPPVKSLLKLLLTKGELSNQQIRTILQLKDRRRFRESYITPSLQAKFIEYVIPDKPTSRHQRYRITELGRKIMA